MTEYDAIILAGGRARRLGGADKPGALVGGRSLVSWSAGAVADAGLLVLVGPPRAELPGAVVVREDPPGAGPVPALRAGLAAVRAPRVALLAADLPFLRLAHVSALLARGGAAVLVDGTGRPQWLCGVWPAELLRAALTSYRGSSLRGLLAPLDPALVELPSATAHPPWYDCDTPEDLALARDLATP